MAILAIFVGDFNKSQYESLRKEVNWEKQHPHGGIFHAAGFDEFGDIHVADVWESAEAMNTFVERRLGPALQKLKISAPEVTIYPIHNMNAYQAIEKYKT